LHTLAWQSIGAYSYHLPLLLLVLRPQARSREKSSQPGPSKIDEEDAAGSALCQELAMLRAAKATCQLAIVQDMADALMAINEIRGESC